MIKGPARYEQISLTKHCSNTWDKERAGSWKERSGQGPQLTALL